MIRLLPTTSLQEISIVPRDTTSIEGVSLTIKEEGTGVTEVLNDVTCYIDGNSVCVDLQSTILREDFFYMLTFMQDGLVWFLTKAYATSHTDKDTRFTLNNNQYIHGEESNEGYTVIE
jgi:hypothetical protein